MDKPTCSIDGCEKPVVARGWCRTHYTRWYETGSTELGVRPPRRVNYTRTPAADRVLARSAESDSGCWEFQGYLHKNGYGTVFDYESGGMSMIHRVVWAHFNGPIPDGLQLDHLCRVRHCVNPDHLEPVTPKVNTNRGLGAERSRAWMLARTHCKRGHEFDEENTRIYRGTRICRACKRLWQQKNRKKKQNEHV